MISPNFVNDFVPFSWYIPGQREREIGMFHYRYTPYSLKTLRRFWLIRRLYRFTVHHHLHALGYSTREIKEMETHERQQGL